MELSIILTALALVRAGAHLFFLPRKIGLVQEDYFIAQSLYRGWALFGIVLISALAANIALSIVVSRFEIPAKMGQHIPLSDSDAQEGVAWSC